MELLSVERFDRKARETFGRHGRTVVHRGEVLRHPVYTRVLHWTVAISFVLALLSGFAIYSPWLYRWLTPLFGGGRNDAFPASVVWAGLHDRFLLSVPELVCADALDRCRHALDETDAGVRRRIKRSPSRRKQGSSTAGRNCISGSSRSARSCF